MYIHFSVKNVVGINISEKIINKKYHKIYSTDCVTCFRKNFTWNYMVHCIRFPNYLVYNYSALLRKLKSLLVHDVRFANDGWQKFSFTKLSKVNFKGSLFIFFVGLYWFLKALRKFVLNISSIWKYLLKWKRYLVSISH